MKDILSNYNDEFYKDMIREHSVSNLSSAKEIVPYLLKIFENTSSVVDLGCGIGVWLSVFKQYGVSVKGVDGEWVNHKLLLIEEEEFQEFNLEKRDITLLNPNTKYDIAISLEVAEHLSERAGKRLVSALTRLSDVVVFSAAIPNQGGDGHINEQWQSYWVRKFDEVGYKSFDLLRGKFWDNPKVQYYYAQNMLIYINKNSDIYNTINRRGNLLVSDIIHPKQPIFHNEQSWKRLLVKQYELLRVMSGKIVKSIKNSKKSN